MFNYDISTVEGSIILRIYGSGKNFSAEQQYSGTKEKILESLRNDIVQREGQDVADNLLSVMKTAYTVLSEEDKEEKKELPQEELETRVVGLLYYLLRDNLPYSELASALIKSTIFNPRRYYNEKSAAEKNLIDMAKTFYEKYIVSEILRNKR